jgi:hypothetical protein
MATKLMACKMIRTFHKEEVPAVVFATATQCVNGTMLSWAPYLLNLFLDDCKDMQDLGIDFNYSWFLIMIALVRWREPPYSYFCDMIGHYHAAWYTSMGITLDHKRRSGNACTFMRYFDDN